MKKSIFLFFAAILYATSAWAAWCGNSFITVNGLWCTGSNSYVHDGGKFHGKDLGTLTTLSLGGELQVWPSSTTAGTLCYKIDDGTENSISLPKTGTEGSNSKHSGSGAVDLSGLAGGSHSIAVWFKHGSDIDNNGGSNFVATFTIAAATPEPEPIADVTVHFINSVEWATVACHHWIPGGAGTSWPGDVLSKTDEIAGYDVYTATFTGAHTSCIFNNNNNGNQTGDLTVEDGKYYEVNTNTWYADKAAAEAALATPIPDETVYLINTGNWSKAMIHTWNGVGGTAWPGVEMTLTGETIEGYAVYSYTAKQGGQANLLFQESENVNKTSDLTWEAGKYYAPLKNEWYDTKEAAAEALAAPVEYEYVYLINTNDWAAAHIYTWTPEVASYPGAAMTKESEQIAGKDVYSYKVVKGSTFGGLNFNCGGDECKTGDLTWQAGKYYAPSKNTWFDTKEAAAEALAAPVVTYDYYLTGSLVGGWDVKQQGIEKDAELYKATFTELNAGIYEFKITAGDWEHQWNYNNLGAAYEEVSQGVDGEGNPNGNIKIVTEEAKNITVIFDGSKITFEGLTPYVAPLTYTVTVPAGTEKCYIAGAFAQSNWNTFLEMEQVVGEDKFTITITGAKETDEYKYACQADWAYAEVIDGGGNRTNWSELDEVEKWGKPVIVTYQLKGVGGWEQPGIELVQNPDPEKASEYMLTCQAISATDAIKVVRLEDGVIKDYYGNGTVKDEVTVAVSYDGEANIKLPEGKYNFYFDTNASEKKLWIEAATGCVTEPTPEVIREGLTVGQWGTLCPTQNVENPTGATFYQIAYLEEKDDLPFNMHFNEVTGTLQAGQPYFFIASATEIKGVKSGEVKTEGVKINGFCGYIGAEAWTLPYQESFDVNNDNTFVIWKNSVFRINAETSIKSERCYIIINKTQPSRDAVSVPAGARRITMGVSGINGQNTATGMENVDASAQPVKTIINGQLYILRGEKMYDAQGKLVK